MDTTGQRSELVTAEWIVAMADQPQANHPRPALAVQVERVVDVGDRGDLCRRMPETGLPDFDDADTSQISPLEALRLSPRIPLRQVPRCGSVRAPGGLRRARRSVDGITGNQPDVPVQDSWTGRPSGYARIYADQPSCGLRDEPDAQRPGVMRCEQGNLPVTRRSFLAVLDAALGGTSAEETQIAVVAHRAGPALPGGPSAVQQGRSGRSRPAVLHVLDAGGDLAHPCLHLARGS